MTTRPDFYSINQAAIARLPELLRARFPHGRVEGDEFVIGSVASEAGRSLHVVLRGPKAGLFQDFAAPDVHGNDPVALFAVADGVSMGEAARRLAHRLGLNGASRPPPPPPPPPESS